MDSFFEKIFSPVVREGREKTGKPQQDSFHTRTVVYRESGTVIEYSFRTILYCHISHNAMYQTSPSRYGQSDSCFAVD